MGYSNMSFLVFCLDAMLIPPPNDGDEVPETQGALAKNVFIASDDIVARKGGVIDVALASRCGVVVQCEDLCGVLSDCLQYVSFVPLMVSCFLSPCWIFIYVCVRDRQ
jgi:hypothetical protein